MDPGSSCKTLLIVDDNPRNLFALGAVLEEHGYATVAARSAEQALAKLASGPEVACILIDLMMPDMDGYELARRIHAQQRFAGIPLLAVTAKTDPQDKEQVIKAGCAGYIAKPVDTSELLRIVGRLCHR